MKTNNFPTTFFLTLNTIAKQPFLIHVVFQFAESSSFGIPCMQGNTLPPQEEIAVMSERTWTGLGVGVGSLPSGPQKV